MSVVNPLLQHASSSARGECWICLAESDADRLVALQCLCKRVVHPACARRWYDNKIDNPRTCETCRTGVIIPPWTADDPPDPPEPPTEPLVVTVVVAAPPESADERALGRAASHSVDSTLDYDPSCKGLLSLAGVAAVILVIVFVMRQSGGS